MRRLVSTSAMLLVCLSSQSQDWEQVRDDCRYVWGEGWGTSLEEADRQALASLVSKVSVTVTSDYRSVEQQVRSTGGNDDYELLFNHQRVCSSLTLPYTQRTVLRSGCKSHVGRWILREDLESIFADRRDRILEYERCASAAEQEDRLWWSTNSSGSCPSTANVASARPKSSSRDLMSPERHRFPIGSREYFPQERNLYRSLQRC